MTEHTTAAALRHIVIHTDGACIGNPGQGGWGAILQLWKGQKIAKTKRMSGSSAETTNNRMELQAAINALTFLRSNHPLTVRSDSEYLIKGMSEWLAGWKAKGWRKADKKPVRNADLWRQLDTLNDKRTITWEWMRGHSGDWLNEEADRLAHVQHNSML